MPCTCGKCVGGFLSPLNADLIRDTATSSASILRDSMPAFPTGQSLHRPAVYMIEYVPPELRVEVARPFAEGFANCMDSIAYALRQGQMPKPRVVAQCATLLPGVDKEATKFYLSNGGTAEYALDAVLAACEAAAAEGSGSGAGPACANDGNWELLRQQIFINSEFWPCGPYDDDEEEFWGGADNGGDDGDGWVHYDTSNWVPPQK